MTAAVRAALLVFLGTLVSQLAWIVALPPFHGIDEFEHVYRAAAVARGDWEADRQSAESGRGGVVTVPADLVQAANARCESLPYTSAESCSPIADLGGGMVTVASAATNQSPVLYAVLGTVALPFEGTTADIAMRVGAATLAAGLIALGAYATALTSRTRWPMVALLAAMTPVFMYSTAIPAGNGLEMAAGLVCWSALLGLLDTRDHQVQRALILIAGVGATTLISLRQLGPVFLVLIAVATILFAERRRLLALLLAHRRTTSFVAVSTLLAGGLHASWIAVAGYASQPADREKHLVSEYLAETLLWLLQGIGTGSYRNVPAPMLTYALALPVGLGLVWAAWRYGQDRRLSMMLFFVILGTLVLPIVFTEMTYEQRGSFWQGRYGLAFTVGVLVIAGRMLDRAAWQPRHGALGLWLLFVLLLGAHISNPVAVAWSEWHRAEAPVSDDWVPVAAAISVVVLSFSGWLIKWLSITRMPTNG